MNLISTTCMSYRLYSCIMLYQYPHAIPVLYVLKDKFSGTFPPPPKKNTTFGYIFGGLGFNRCISTWSFLCQGNQGISARPPDILPGDPLTHHVIIPGCCSEKTSNPSETKHHTCLNPFQRLSAHYVPRSHGRGILENVPSGTYRLPF